MTAFPSRIPHTSFQKHLFFSPGQLRSKYAHTKMSAELLLERSNMKRII